jgi:polypeptide N-acetylgalactosaminyltransferase
MMLVAKVKIYLKKQHSVLNKFLLFAEELKSPLDARIANLRKTRVIRLSKREGLIRTRIAGAREAKGEVLIFFDSHIEVNTNWLPPLIEPIALNYKTSVCPFIDIIKWENFAYIAQDEGLKYNS